MLRAVRLTSDGVGGRLELDGEQLHGLRAADVRVEAGHRPRLVLDLAVMEMEIESGGVDVVILETTRASLIKLGWTPPEDDA